VVPFSIGFELPWWVGRRFPHRCRGRRLSHASRSFRGGRCGLAEAGVIVAL
jgi:hypothetical protein